MTESREQSTEFLEDLAERCAVEVRRILTHEPPTTEEAAVRSAVVEIVGPVMESLRAEHESEREAALERRVEELEDTLGDLLSDIGAADNHWATVVLRKSLPSPPPPEPEGEVVEAAVDYFTAETLREAGPIFGSLEDAVAQLLALRGERE